MKSQASFSPAGFLSTEVIRRTASCDRTSEDIAKSSVRCSNFWIAELRSACTSKRSTLPAICGFFKRRHHLVVEPSVASSEPRVRKRLRPCSLSTDDGSASALVRNFSRIRQRLRIAGIVAQRANHARSQCPLLLALARFRLPANFFHRRSQILPQPCAIRIPIAVAHQIPADVVEPSNTSSMTARLRSDCRPCANAR